MPPPGPTNPARPVSVAYTRTRRGFLCLHLIILVLFTALICVSSYAGRQARRAAAAEAQVKIDRADCDNLEGDLQSAVTAIELQSQKPSQWQMYQWLIDHPYCRRQSQ